ncbi:DUF6907 domain-containing protein [Nocardioides sp.]|uniref:DUF6907 domain-containing protein n=1 Tax=Nocardioides sp. TaxID=35761 RepID=UPI0039E6A0C5
MIHDPDSPSWLTEACPAWCAREHREADHPEDRYHQSEPAIVPVIASLAPLVPVPASFEPADLVVRRCRYVADAVEWLAVETLEAAHLRLVLTLESARRLVRAVADQVEAS